MSKSIWTPSDVYNCLCELIDVVPFETEDKDWWPDHLKRTMETAKTIRDEYEPPNTSSVSVLEEATSQYRILKMETDRLRECLGELVRLKNVHDWWDNLHDVDRTEENRKVIDQYKTEKSLAWAKARALLVM